MSTKVFVGNLAFQTKEPELAAAFGAVSEVLSANIITRGKRSLGYGFVELKNEEDAKKCVQAMDKKEIDGRPINVEIAQVREQQPADSSNPEGGSTWQKRGGFRGGRGGAPASSSGAPAPTGTTTTTPGQQGIGGGFRGRGRGGFRGRGRGGFFRRAGEGEENTTSTTTTTTTTNNNNNNTNNATNADRGSRPPRRGSFSRGTRGRGGRGRGGYAPRDNSSRTQSTTSLFVANVPFSYQDADLEKVFKDAALSIKAAHVITKRNGRSKGFGFVEFNTEEDQQKAMQAIDGKEVDGRKLSVKVALTENKPAEGADDDDDNTGGAPSGGAAPQEKKDEEGKAK